MKYVLFTFLFLLFPSICHAYCFGGEAETYINVEICDDKHRQCIAFCIIGDRWDTTSGIETIQRFMYAVADGELELSKISKALRHGIRPGVKWENLGLTVRSETCRSQPSGVIYGSTVCTD